MKIHNITQEQLDDTKPQDRKWRWPGVTGPGRYTWNEAENRYEAAPLIPDNESPHDFSHSGLGIGGLSSYEEPTVIPTVKQMERLEKMEQRATRCRRCGQSDEFDGAMFTTGGGNVCDDCFG